MPSNRARRGSPRAPSSLASAMLLAALLALVAAPTALHAQGLPAGFDDAWGAAVADHRAALEAAGVVGGTVALVRAVPCRQPCPRERTDGPIVAVDHYGMADLERGRAVDEHTIYHWASITKTFTGVGVMQLRDRGLLALDDPIVEYVPELRDVHNPYGPMDAITLRQLMSHSAGFRAPTWPWGGGEDWHPHEPTEWSQLVAMIPYTRIHFPPGSRYSYSNPGIIFLGRTIERVTGDVYEAYIDKNIFRPLDMRRSYFDVTPRHLRGHRSNNYRVVDGRPVANGREFNTGITVSNGGLNAPVGDMAKWVAFLLGARGARGAARDDVPAGRRAAQAAASGGGAADDAQVLARSSLEEMWRPVVPIDGASPLGEQAMGLSFFLYDRRGGGRRLIGHTGSQKSFRSFILLDPAAGVGAIGAVNTASGDETAPPSRRILAEFQARVAREVFPLFGSDPATDGR